MLKSCDFPGSRLQRPNPGPEHGQSLSVVLRRWPRSHDSVRRPATPRASRQIHQLGPGAVSRWHGGAVLLGGRVDRERRGFHRGLLQKHEPERRRERVQTGTQRQVLEPGLLLLSLFISAQQGKCAYSNALFHKNRSVSGFQGWDVVFLWCF